MDTATYRCEVAAPSDTKTIDEINIQLTVQGITLNPDKCISKRCQLTEEAAHLQSWNSATQQTLRVF